MLKTARSQIASWIFYLRVLSGKEISERCAIMFSDRIEDDSSIDYGTWVSWTLCGTNASSSSYVLVHSNMQYATRVHKINSDMNRKLYIDTCYCTPYDSIPQHHGCLPRWHINTHGEGLSGKKDLAQASGKQHFYHLDQNNKDSRHRLNERQERWVSWPSYLRHQFEVRRWSDCISKFFRGITSFIIGKSPPWWTPMPLLSSSRILNTCGNCRSPPVAAETGILYY